MTAQKQSLTRDGQRLLRRFLTLAAEQAVVCGLIVAYLVGTLLSQHKWGHDVGAAEDETPDCPEPWGEPVLLLDPEDDPVTVHARMHALDALSASADVLAQLRSATSAAGFAGDPWVIELIYLAGTTRLFDRPVSVNITAASSTGKSFALAMGLRSLPEEAVYELTAASEKALIYTDEEFAHRIIVLAEASGVSGGFMAYALRSLLSEGRLRYEVTDFESRSTVRLDKQGPTGLFLSTTGVIDTELGTRMLLVSPDESQAQTEHILVMLANEAAGRHAARTDALEPFRDLQRELGRIDVDVVVPFARTIADLIERAPVRMRRDFRTVLDLVRAHALIHGESRWRDDDGRLVAEVADYAAVHRLVDSPVAQAAQATLPKHVLETVTVVGEILDNRNAGGGGFVTTRDLEQHLGLDESTVRRRIQKAVEYGFLRDGGGGPGRRHELSLGVPLPADRAVLPRPEEVRAAWAVQQ